MKKIKSMNYWNTFMNMNAWYLVKMTCLRENAFKTRFPLKIVAMQSVQTINNALANAKTGLNSAEPIRRALLTV